MAITLGSNITSLGAQRQLFSISNELSTTFERLSSGQRINRASDDAAGIAVATQLNVSARVFGQAVRNVNDVNSYIAIADGALSQLSAVLTRTQELAEQSANGVYSQEQRGALSSELELLVDEYNRIVESTEFNGKKVFDSRCSSLQLQAGFGNEASLDIKLGESISTTIAGGTPTPGTIETASISIDWLEDFAGTQVLTQALRFQDASAMAQSSYFTFDYSGSSYYVWYDIDGGGVDPGLAGFDGSFQMSINSTDTAAQVASATQGPLATPFESVSGARIGGPLTTITGVFGSGLIPETFVGQFVTVDGNQIYLSSLAGNNTIAEYTDALAAQIDSISGVSASSDGSTVDVSFDTVGDQTDITGSSAIGLLITQGQDEVFAETTRKFTIDGFDISTQESSRIALDEIQLQRSRVITERGNLGAAQSRLSSLLSLLQGQKDLYYQAAGRITDADIATESSNLISANIRQQVSSSILSQANQQPALAIQLLS